MTIPRMGAAKTLQCAAAVPRAAAAPIRVRRGAPLPPEIRHHAEQLFGVDLSDVRVHVSDEPRRFRALAFTTGSDIFVAPGQYDPGSERGIRLLGHELAHVVQQRCGRAQNPHGYGVAVVNDPALEGEADRMGAALADRVRGPISPRQAPASRWQAPVGQSVQRASAERLQRGRALVAQRSGKSSQQPVAPALMELRNSQGITIGMPLTGDNGGSIMIFERIDVYNTEDELAGRSVFAISYLNADVSGAHWLQFVWIEIEGKAPGKEPFWLEGSIPTPTGPAELTVDPRHPVWKIDAIRSNGSSFYDVSGGAHIASADEITLIDSPGLAKIPAKKEPNGFVWTATNHFMTYLVKNGAILVVVPWTSTQKSRMENGEVVTYRAEHKAGTPEQVTKLPAALHMVLAFEDAELATILPSEQ